MFRLEVTGDTLDKFYGDAVNALLLVTRGGQNLTTQPAEEQKPSQSAVDGPAPGEAAAATVVTAEPNPPVAPKPERKPRKTPAPTIELKAEPVKPVELAAPAEEDPLGLDTPAPAPKTELTLADMRQRVQDIITAHGPKTDKNPNARGNEMAVVVPYVRKLFAPFGIKLAAELKPEQFAEFWAASQAYLDGSAA